MDEKEHPKEEESEEIEANEPESKDDVQGEGDATSPEVQEGDEKDKEIAELHSKLQYLQAEYENLKKRAAKDLEAIVKFGNEGLVTKLLPILDDFEASLNSVEDSNVRKGFELLLVNLMKTLKDEGLEEIKALGESFDPFRHEAVLETDDPDKEEDEVVEVLQKGYLFKSKVIRASKVKVIKHNSEKEEKGEENG
jgi:molecular chaperone GrpE